MYLLDTVALSEPQRAVTARGVSRFFDLVPNVLLYTSAVALGEVWYGICSDREPARRARLESWFGGTLLPSFESRILPVTRDISMVWGERRAAAAVTGQTLPPVDALIAATAIVHNLTVVTRNVRDFERCGARVLNPWES